MLQYVNFEVLHKTSSFQETQRSVHLNREAQVKIAARLEFFIVMKPHVLAL